MKTAFIVRNREGKPYFVATTSDSGTTFRVVSEAAKTLVDAFKDEYKDSKITKQELSVALDRGMTVEGPMPETLVAQALRREPKPKEKTDEQVSVSDLPITFFSTKEKREAVEFKARAFVSESRKTTFNYEVKRVRAIWDPGLSIPGTGRRGGWRCPVGTRYGGQITDRFGRNCGWGVARRIANAITNIGERMEGLDDRRRGRRVERRNRRMLERLGRAEGGGRIERGLRGVAEALEGGERTTPTAPPTPPRDATPTPPRRRGPARRVRRGGFDSEARDAGLRDSERRRVRRELEEPGAPRTDLEELVEPKPKPKRPARARRRKASEDRAKDTAGKRPAGEPMEPSAKPQPTPQRKKPTTPKPEPKKPTTPVDDNDPFNILVSNINNLIPLTDDDKKKMKALWDEQEFSEDEQDRMDDMVRDGNYGDVEDLKERIAINDDEKRMATERIDKDMKLLRENNPTAGEREGALRRIVLNKQDIRRRDLENEMFQKAVDDPPWRRSNPPETPPSPPRATPPTPPKAPTPPEAPEPKADNGAENVKTASVGAPQIKEDAKVVPRGPDGLPIGKGKRISRDIRSIEDAVKHLKDGGDLQDIPDLFVIDALEDNSEDVAGKDARYSIELIGNRNVNGMLRVFTDKTTGKKYFLKYEQRRAHGYQEDVAEVLGNNIAGRMGFPVGGFRFVGPAYNDVHGQGRAILFEHASNYVKGELKVPWEGNVIDVGDAVAMSLLDFVILNTDRHGGNFFVVENPDGSHNLVPIDMSLTFGQVFFDKDKDYADEDGLTRWIKYFGGRNIVLEDIYRRLDQGKLTRAQVVEQVIALQKRLRENEEKVQFARFGRDVMEAAGGADGERKLKGNDDHMVDFTNRRLKWLMETDPETITRVLLDG